MKNVIMDLFLEKKGERLMELTATVTAIGEKALSPKDNMVILFGDKATAALREVSVIQQFDDPEAQKSLNIAHGDHIYINDIKYRVAAVGSLANPNLKQIAHATLIFQPVPDEDMLGNAIYLTPYAKPTFSIGTTIRYVTAD
jgi:PTS system glucitol/sorbitol-specific IIA component